ncbi:MAG: hypothetical protein IKL32_05405, partial [Alphaproteobacteria bacterium]|nr:hypothetical protein [Alphaproteobacteria bacterium]
NKRPRNYGGFMAYFTETSNCIELKHHLRTVCVLKKPTATEIEQKTAAVFTWSDETVPLNNQFKLAQRKLTITTPGDLAKFVVSACVHGFSFEKYLFGQKDGKQIWANDLEGAFCVQTYKNGILQEEYSKIDAIYTHKKFDVNRGTYRVFEKEKLADGTVMRKTYYTYNDLQSQTVYTIKTPAGRLLEEGTLDANNQKHGTIMTYDKNGRRKNSYYENGVKLSFGQRLFGFKRKVSSRTPSQHVSQNELTR